MSTPATRPTGGAGKVRLRAGTPDAVLAVVPHLLGFYPSHSLVVLGLGEENRVMVTFRYDLPEPDDYELAADIADHAEYVLDRERISAAVLVGYGADDLVVPVITTTGTRLVEAGIRLHEVLRADAGRYWSMLCNDVACCPAEGRPYDPGSHPAAATMAEAGLTAHPDREALARTLQRPAGTSDLILRATSLAQLRLAELVRMGEADGDRDPQLRVVRVGRKAVQQAIRRYRSGGSITRADQLAWLAVLLADLRVRDDAWARMDPAHHDQHCLLWTDVIRGAAHDYLPAPASLLAFTAWQAGNGALAAMAVERALTADPGYSMAQLLAGAIEAALPPSAARMPMTPAAVAASYAATFADRPQATGSRSGRAARSAGPGRRAGSGGPRAGATGASRAGSAGGSGDKARPRAAARRRERAVGRQAP
jgi:Domain of unknown function (DUF4192)